MCHGGGKEFGEELEAEEEALEKWRRNTEEVEKWKEE